MKTTATVTQLNPAIPGLPTPEPAFDAAARRGSAVLGPGLSADAALRRIGLACLDHISRNQPDVLAGLEDGTHQMRVGVRRLRAALSAFHELLPEHQRRWASEELRWLANALGPARNLDVFDSMLIEPAREKSEDSAAFEALSQAARRHRRGAYRAAAVAIRSGRYAALMSHLGRWFKGYGWRDGDLTADLKPLDAIAEHALQRRWRAAKKRGKAFAGQSPARRHRLRIALKKLRYTAEALAGLYPRGRVDLFTRRLRRLQDHLGDANDVAIGHDILAKLAQSRSQKVAITEVGERLLGWHEERLAKHEPKVRKHLHELFETKPFWHH